MAIITIAREFGSTGREISQMVAQQLNYAYVDRQKIMQDIKTIGGERWEKLAEQLDEHYPNIWERFDWSFRGVVSLEQEILLNYALNDKVVLLGRGGNFLLKGIPYVLRILLVMSKEARIERVMKGQDLPLDIARLVVAKTDQEMARSIHFIYEKKWDDPLEYDLILDLDSQQADDVVKIIVAALDEKQNKYSDQAKKTLLLRATAAKVKAGIVTNPRFLIPVFDVELKEEEIILRGVVHSLKEQKKIEEEARKLAGEVPITFELHQRGLIRS